MDSPIEKQVNDPDEFDSSCIFFDSNDTELVPADSITPVNFIFPFEVDFIDYKSLGLGTIESSLVNSTLIMALIEVSEAENVSTKVTCIRSLLLNMILILLFLGDRILIWIHNYLLASFCCSSYK